MAIIRNIHVKAGEASPELGLVVSPADMSVDILYVVDAVEIISDNEASARYKTLYGGAVTGLGRFEFAIDDNSDLFSKAEISLKEKLEE